MKVNVASLPVGMDPDDYIQKNGKERFEADVIGNALTWTAFKLQYYRLGKNLKNEGDQLQYIEEVMKELSRVNNAIERELYFRQIAEEFSLSFDVLLQQQKKLLQLAGVKGKKNEKQPFQQSPMDPALASRRASGIPKAHVIAERKLIARMLKIGS